MFSCLNKKIEFSFFLLLILFIFPFAFSQEVKKNEDNKKIEKELENLLNNNYETENSSIFEGVVSVQNRARKKSNSFLFYPYYAVDFSDTPYTMWAPNLSLGWAFGEFVEIYANYASGFNNTERFLSKKFKQYTLDGGGIASIDIQKAKSQMGLEINWAPIYGKDSWGPYAVIRSDMFLTLGLYSIKYESEKSGNRIKFGIGKTFFISKYFNLRLTASLSNVEYLSTDSKDSSLVGYGDMGFVFYL